MHDQTAPDTAILSQDTIVSETQLASVNPSNCTVGNQSTASESSLQETSVPAKKTVIRVENLRKVYRIGDERVVALDNIHFSVEAGQVVCIVGTSGSGKSTLLNQLAGLEKPTKGCVYIGSTNLSALSESALATFRQRYLGFVFQSYNLLPTMTALENVALPLTFKGVPKMLREMRAKKMLKLVGLGKRMRHRPPQMSGGQQQRVGIARAFVGKPKVIFADEPTGNLDTKTTTQVMEMMLTFARKNNETLIIVTHEPDIAAYADRVITLIDGRIQSDKMQTPKPISSNPVLTDSPDYPTPSDDPSACQSHEPPSQPSASEDVSEDSAVSPQLQENSVSVSE